MTIKKDNGHADMFNMQHTMTSDTDHSDEIRPLQLYIALTDACNLRCPHCYQSRTNGEDSYDEAHLISTIDATLDGSKAFAVLYGGEPTLTMDRIYRVVEHLSERSEVALGIQTNGTHLNRLLPLATRLSFVLVSVNSTTRDFIRVTDLCRLSRTTNVIGRFVYDGTDLAALVQEMSPYLHYVYWQIVNGPHPPGSIPHYRLQLDRLLRIATTESCDTKFIPFEYIRTASTNAIDASYPLCGFGTSLRYIAPSGRVYACDELSDWIGIVKAPKVVEMVSRTCSDCEVLGICRTRCPAILLKYGISTFREYCNFTRTLIAVVQHRLCAETCHDELFAVTEVIP